MKDKLKTFLFIFCLVLGIVALIIELCTFLQYQENNIMTMFILFFDIFVVSVNAISLYIHISTPKK